MKVRVLGCGPSNGIPSLSRGFGLCDAHNPKNTRTRSAILLETNDGKRILIDSDPEIRLQLLEAGSPTIDAVIYTHGHYDHMGGADDLRSYSQDKNKSLPIYLTKDNAEHFKELLRYLFKNDNQSHLFDLHIIEPYKPFYIGNNEIIPIRQYHGLDREDPNCLSMGYRIGNFAYSTDVKEMDPKGFELLQGIDTWLLGVVTTRESNKHIHLSKALEWIDYIKPRQTYMTHMGLRMDYDTLCKELPESIRPSYDGFEFTV